MNTDNHIVPEYAKSPYFHVGRATELSGRDRITYRLLEIFPGAFTWFTLLGTVVLSYFLPIWAAYFIIAFDLYWLLKTIYLIIHHVHNWRRIKHNLKADWQSMLNEHAHDHIYHLLILPYYKEGEEVLRDSIESFIRAKYRRDRLLLVLGSEERAGEDFYELGLKMKQEYGEHFADILVTKHPKDLPGEMPGKGSNISWAAEQARLELLDPKGIKYEDVIVSAFDVDTTVYDQYFLCLTWHFLTCDDPYHSSFQPVPFYHNNIWRAPAVSRVVATSGTFWQMIQQERPEKLVTFSSHGVSFKALYEIGYWQRNMVSEDSRIFWNLFMAHNGEYKTVPISYPISMDANLAGSFWQTSKNIYKQQRRWSWGVENLPYILFSFMKNKKISMRKKVSVALNQIEGYWSLATNPLFILLLGWLPLVLGGKAFNETVLSYNLPLVTRNLMTLAMVGLVFSAIISISLLPDIPADVRRKKSFWFSRIFQWVLIPFTIVVFGAIPGIDAQTRLMIGNYMGFWVTPKQKR